MQSQPDFFTILPEDKVPEAGKILISEPYLADMFFNKTIIYIVGHSEAGSVGFILNKRLDIQVREAVSGFEKCTDFLSIGGPVSPETLHYIHKRGDLIPDSVKVADNIFWGGDIDAVRSLVRDNRLGASDIRFFLGYSGWSGGQLAKELNEDSWLAVKPATDVLFREGIDVNWKTVVGRLGNKYRVWAYFPESPDLN